MKTSTANSFMGLLRYLFAKPVKPVKPSKLVRPANHSFPSDQESRLEYARQMGLIK